MLRYLTFFLLFLLTTEVYAQENSVYYCSPLPHALFPSDDNVDHASLVGTKATQPNWADMLGWLPSSKNLCHGYYFEPPAITAQPNPSPIGTTQTTISSTGLTTFAENEPSTLNGDVTVTQPGRELTADQATLYRNPDTGKIRRIDLKGHVAFREAGKMAVGESSRIDLEQKTIAVSKGAYHVSRPTRTGSLDSWGVVDQFYRETTGILQLCRVTYSTCSPKDVSWHLKANHLTLNKITGVGTARNAWFYAGSVPVFYTPYASFPIDKRRYSGFLYPTFTHDNQSGYGISLPYYFNLAPNYDDTLTVTPISSRGIYTINLFRYLTTSSDGYLQLGYLPNDRAFNLFKQNIPAQYPPSFAHDPYLNALDGYSNDRSSIGLHDYTQIDPKWSGALDVNYVSDPYYFQNLGSTAQLINTDQLINQGEVRYQDENWQFMSRVQAYQTLHAINQNFVADQYQRLPQMDFNVNYPGEAHGLDFAMNTEWIDFQHADDFFTSIPFPTGNRAHVSPQVSIPFTQSYGYFTPTLAVDSTGYAVIHNGVVSSSGAFVTPDAESNFNRVRTLPLFDIDSGLYFDRSFFAAGNGYRQTLEPRMYYLYVPQNNQNDIPVFDTTLPTFDVSQLFRNNRFVGYDRVGDANQISVGLTSRVLDDFTGQEKLNATIGEIYYLHRQTVCLYPNCSDDPNIGEATSPITGKLLFTPNAQWSASATAAWDPSQSGLNNAGAGIRYIPLPQHVLDLGYNYVQNGDQIDSVNPNSPENNLQRVNLAAAWPITEHWNAMGDWNYNLSHHHPETYLYGVEYDSCCWALRFVASHTLSAENTDDSAQYRSSYFVQFLLKGLGAVGNSSAGNVLMGSIPGYIDKFKG